MDFDQLIQKCEALLRGGKTQDVAPLLAAIKPAQIPKEHRKPLASVCRRAGLLTLGLKILAPNVRDLSLVNIEKPQPAEMAEYGALLWRVGAVSEALSVLEAVDSREAPEALLYQAFCYFSQWEYAEALPILEMYLRAPLSRYAAMVGCVNICAALVGTRRYGAARDLLNSNLELTRHGGFWRLHSNCLELSAQVHIHQGEFDKARLDLSRASQLLNDQRMTDQLYIKKWQAILTAFETEDVNDLVLFREEAKRRDEWESVREADLFWLKFRFDEEKFDHLIFGTPFLPYRERAMLELGKKPARAAYTYGAANAPTLDIATGTLGGCSSDLKPGNLVHRVLEALTRDLYRPHSLGAFFSAMFPGQHFDPYSSPNRLHKLVSRTRKWLESRQFAANVESLSSGYRLNVTGDFAMRLPLEHSPVSRHSLHWDRIVMKFQPNYFFSAHEGRAHLGITPTTFKRLMRWAVEQELVEKRGGGSNVLYKLKAS